MIEWKPIDSAPIGEVVETKIDDHGGVRNVALLKAYQRDPTTRIMWFHPDMSMYVYYQPTHWRPA